MCTHTNSAISADAYISIHIWDQDRKPSTSSNGQNATDKDLSGTCHAWKRFLVGRGGRERCRSDVPPTQNLESSAAPEPARSGEGIYSGGGGRGRAAEEAELVE